jgi:hypothetical protein
LFELLCHRSLTIKVEKNMKKIALLVAFLLQIFTLSAQQFHVEKSAEFEEPDFGWNKLLQLKNGNTFYFHSTRKNGIEVTVYNKQRKQIASHTLESNLWDVSKMKQSKIVGLHEINGQPVLFIMQGDGRIPALYRMLINPNTGARMGEAKLGELPKVSLLAGYQIAFGNADIPDIIVEKDPNSDCYAVIYFDGLAHDRNDRIKVVHYDGSHKVLNTALYDAPQGKYKSLRYIGATVDGNKRVFITTYGFNGKADEDAEPAVIISRINAGETKFTHSVIKVSNDFNNTKSVMLYNHNTNKIVLMTVTYHDSGPMGHTVKWDNDPIGYYSKKEVSCITLLSLVNPESLKLESTKPAMAAKVDAYGKQNIDKDYEFDGVPQNMVLNKDNTMTILMEDLTNVEQRHNYVGQKNSTFTGNKYATGNHIEHGHASVKSYLGPVGVSELSASGDEINGYAIAKKQQASGTLPILYMAGRSNGVFQYPQTVGSGSNDNQFLSYDYIYTGKNRYVIFNDMPSNSEKDEDEEKRKTVTNISKTNTMCCQLNDPKIDKSFLFGKPEGGSASTYCYIQSSDFNKDLNVYATLIEERDGKSRCNGQNSWFF